MTIVVTGGGSGGHITPILAVARELKQIRSDVRIVYVGQAGDALADIPASDKNIDDVFTVRAGKFRRYHGEGLAQLLDLRTMWLNIRDGFYVLVGLWQSFWLMRKLRPSIVFTRGGFVSVPVAYGAWLNRIPYITHDSDALPSLANRLIAHGATLHAVALPEEVYPYPIDKTLTVGVPIGADYQPATPDLMRRYRQELSLEGFEHMVFVTGGGNGAQAINNAVLENAEYLLTRYPHLVIVQATGRAHEEQIRKQYQDKLPADLLKRIMVKGFITDLYRYSGAADVVIARAGATNLAEFAAQGKACIIVPSAFLTGGHQLKNAVELAKQGAIIQLTDEQIEQERRLASVVAELLDSPSKRAGLGRQLSTFAHPDAARHLAMVLLDKANGKNR